MSTNFERFSEEALLAMLGWGEARGEGALGILAVQWVAKNRADKRNRALKDVILQPWQFSCFNPGPGQEKLVAAAHLEPESWGMSLGSAGLLLGGHTLDPTAGATHFYSVTIQPPRWTKGWIELTQIGRHIFGIAR